MGVSEDETNLYTATEILCGTSVYFTAKPYLYKYELTFSIFWCPESKRKTMVKLVQADSSAKVFLQSEMSLKKKTHIVDTKEICTVHAKREREGSCPILNTVL